MKSNKNTDKSKNNIVLQRFNFNTRNQRDHENFDNFIQDLKQLIVFCEFGDQEKSLLRDRIILGVNNESLQKRLLCEENLTCDKAIAICRFIEWQNESSSCTPSVSDALFNEIIWDNYASTMYRVKINTIENSEPTTKSLILKVIPSKQEHNKILVKNKIYPREIKIYTEILADIKILLQSISDSTKLSPKCYYTTTNPTSMLIFEDLNEAGFRMKNRQFGLDLEESLFVLEKIAKLHACSAYLYDRDSSIMDMYLDGCITNNPNCNEFMEIYRTSANMLKKIISKWEGFEDLAKKLDKFSETFIKKGIEVYTRDDNAFNVLNHNDIWINNLMFKYNDLNQLEDIIFIDFQLAYWGSPGIDLNYFLYGTVRDDIRDKYFKFLIKHYHEILSKTLEKLNYRGNYPTVQDIHIQLIKTGFHAVNASICLRPLCVMEKNEEADMELYISESFEGITFRDRIFTNPTYISFIKTLIIEFDLMGYFD